MCGVFVFSVPSTHYSVRNNELQPPTSNLQTSNFKPHILFFSLYLPNSNQPMNHTAKEHFLEAQKVLETFLSSEENFKKIEAAADALAKAFRNGKKAISCGNGGSMCDAMHFAEELSGRFRSDRKALPALSISDPSHITCTANDYGFDK